LYVKKIIIFNINYYYKPVITANILKITNVTKNIGTIQFTSYDKMWIFKAEFYRLDVFEFN